MYLQAAFDLFNAYLDPLLRQVWNLLRQRSGYEQKSDIVHQSNIAIGLFLVFCCTASGQDATTNAGKSVVVENALLKTIESTHVATEVAGKLEQLLVTEGTQVQLDQPIAKIHNSAVRLKLDRARIAMEASRKKARNSIDIQLAQKKAEVAKNEYDRAINANERIANTYATKEIDRLRLVAESADLEIERARHQQELLELEVLTTENECQQAEELLSRHEVRSPAIGIVTTISKRSGEWVEPGTELVQIVKIDRLRIEGFVDGASVDLQLDKRTAKVTVLKGKKEIVVPGRVSFVSPDANPVNGQVRVYLEIDNKLGEFRPGMRVRAEIDIE